MMQTTFVAFIALSLLCVDVQAQPATQDTPRFRNIPPNFMLSRFDKDNDRRLSRDEVDADLKRVFEKYDSNKDGFLSLRELQVLQLAVMRKSADDIAAALSDSITVDMDVAYRKGDRDGKSSDNAWRLDVVRPANNDGKPLPTVLYFHGWQQDKLHGFPNAVDFAKRGYVCVNVNYRMREPVYKNAHRAVEDAQVAVRWLRANAKTYNIDPERIGGSGYSFGGYLVTLLGIAGPDVSFSEDDSHQDRSSQLQAICCVASAGDLSKRLANSNLPAEQKKRLQRYSVTTYLNGRNEKLPPFLVIHGTADRIEGADSFVKKLKGAGAEHVDYIRIEGAGHALIRRHADTIKPAVTTFFAKHLEK
jgi:acetyl esterase/lipase